jgi:hypothetical protein
LKERGHNRAQEEALRRAKSASGSGSSRATLKEVKAVEQEFQRVTSAGTEGVRNFVETVINRKQQTPEKKVAPRWLLQHGAAGEHLGDQSGEGDDDEEKAAPPTEEELVQLREKRRRDCDAIIARYNAAAARPAPLQHLKIRLVPGLVLEPKPPDLSHIERREKADDEDWEKTLFLLGQK